MNVQFFQLILIKLCYALISQGVATLNSVKNLSEWNTSEWQCDVKTRITLAIAKVKHIRSIMLDIYHVQCSPSTKTDTNMILILPKMKWLHLFWHHSFQFFLLTKLWWIFHMNIETTQIPHQYQIKWAHTKQKMSERISACSSSGDSDDYHTWMKHEY